eukprot:Clim_evm16s22 gene=Clim_evmTU16s22
MVEADLGSPSAGLRLWALQTKLMEEHPELVHRHKFMCKELDADQIADKTPEKPKKQYQWSTSLDEDTSVCAAAKYSCAKIDTLDPTTITARGGERSVDGSLGVFFLDTGSGLAVVKGAKGIGVEVFATLLSLYIGLYSPRILVVDTGSGVGQHWIEAVRRIDHGRAGRFNQMQYLAISEYVKGKSIADYDYLICQELLGTEVDADHPGKKIFFEELTQMLLFDVLVNNNDRLPLIWDNPGNAGNVLFVSEDIVEETTGSKWPIKRTVPCVSSIDCEIVCFGKASEAREPYLARCRDLVTNVMHSVHGDDPRRPLSKPFETIQGKLYGYMDYSFQKEDMRRMEACFLSALNAIDGTQLRSSMDEWIELLVSAFETPLAGLDSVDPSFVVDVLETMQRTSSQELVNGG